MFVMPSVGRAVEVAPRISDREIVERLTRLEEGQKASRSEMNQRFEGLRSEMNQRFEGLRSEMNQRFEAVDKRLDDMNMRISGLQNTMLALFGALITIMVALFGYIVWDRRTMLKPVVKRLDRLEYDVVRDLELRHEEGSLLPRLLKALREHARNDPKLSEILRSFSLL